MSLAGDIASKLTNMKPSEYLYIIGAGHGGINPSTGKYVTSGKRSPKFADGTTLYEGVNNRINAKLIVSSLKSAGLSAVLLVDTWEDISLSDRVEAVNELAKGRKCVYISIHSDAYGKGWTTPSGISAYTSVGDTPSDPFAEIAINNLEDNFGQSVLWRFDNTDGDKDKEAHFYVLKNTSCPAVLFELGFHSNKAQARRMQTDEWRSKIVKSIVDTCKEWDKK